MALQYIKEINRAKVSIELEQIERSIKSKIDEKSSTIGE